MALLGPGSGMPTKGTKDAGTDTLSKLNSSAEVTEREIKEGQRRKSGQEVRKGQ